MNDHDFYYQVESKIIEVDDASIAVRTYGSGPPLVFIHGIFVFGYTWRKLLPELAKKFTCYVLDLPGCGESVYSKDTDFTFTAQANRLNKLFKLLEINGKMNMVAHDTGASIARLSALEKSNTIEKLILINTEIPNHRPPYIPMHQVLSKLPLANLAFRTILKFGFLVRSPLMLGGVYYDNSILKDPSNINPYLKPLADSTKMFGMLEYLKGIEWKVIDDFAKSHKNITAETLLLWGKEDKTFPVAIAKEMVSQFNGNCQFKTVGNACLFPHEESPDVVMRAILEFLG